MNKGFDHLLKFIIDNDIKIIDISLESVLNLNEIGDFHSDPFDRMIIAKTLQYYYKLISYDSAFSKYGLNGLVN